MQQFPFIDLFKSALHVSGTVFAHPLEQFNCIYSFGTMHWSAAGRCIVPKLYIQLNCSWGWVKTVPETCRADLKRSLNGNYCILLVTYTVVNCLILISYQQQRWAVKYVVREGTMSTLRKGCRTDTQEKWVGSADFHCITCTPDIYFHFLKLLNELANFQGPQSQAMPYADSRTYN
jgi:hypothetical protein